jgi:hypothetical protein
MRRIAVEDLADMAECCVGQVVADRLEQAHRRGGIACHAMNGQRIGTQQPAPHWSLVIAAVPVQHAATIPAAIIGVSGCQRAQPVAGQKLAPALVHHPQLHVMVER